MAFTRSVISVICTRFPFDVGFFATFSIVVSPILWSRRRPWSWPSIAVSRSGSWPHFEEILVSVGSLLTKTFLLVQLCFVRQPSAQGRNDHATSTQKSLRFWPQTPFQNQIQAEISCFSNAQNGLWSFIRGFQFWTLTSSRLRMLKSAADKTDTCWRHLKNLQTCYSPLLDKNMCQTWTWGSTSSILIGCSPTLANLEDNRSGTCFCCLWWICSLHNSWSNTSLWVMMSTSGATSKTALGLTMLAWTERLPSAKS